MDGWRPGIGSRRRGRGEGVEKENLGEGYYRNSTEVSHTCICEGEIGQIMAS